MTNVNKNLSDVRAVSKLIALSVYQFPGQYLIVGVSSDLACYYYNAR